MGLKLTGSLEENSGANKWKFCDLIHNLVELLGGSLKLSSVRVWQRILMTVKYDKVWWILWRAPHHSPGSSRCQSDRRSAPRPSPSPRTWSLHPSLLPPGRPEHTDGQSRDCSEWLSWESENVAGNKGPPLTWWVRLFQLQTISIRDNFPDSHWILKHVILWNEENFWPDISIFCPPAASLYPPECSLWSSKNIGVTISQAGAIYLGPGAQCRDCCTRWRIIHDQDQGQNHVS